MAGHDYEIGYRKPPVTTRFQKGQSGNPKGRPCRPIKSDVELWLEMMNDMIVVRENGIDKKISYRELILKTIRAKAVKGNTRAMTMIFNLNKQALDFAKNGDRRTATEAIVEAIQRAHFEAVVPKPTKQTPPVSNDH